MPISDFPTHATLFRDYERELESDYAVKASPKFTDGSFDVNLDADKKVRQWVLRFLVRTPAALAALDAHVESSKYSGDVGSAHTFGFTTRSGEVLAGVRYAKGGYKKDHAKEHIQMREIILEKLP